MSGNKYLLLRLEGPMQSWGLQSWFDIRNTETLPTKSGVVGLLSNALGIKRDERKAIAKLNKLKMAVLCSREGQLLTDYQTVGAGYDKLPPKERALYQLRDAKGKKRVAITKRYYLFDYRFKVVLWGNEETIERCKQALLNPAGILFLGRKACLPSRPVFDKSLNTGNEVISYFKEVLKKEAFEDKEKRIGSSKEILEECRVICETDSDGEVIQDVLEDFNERKSNARKVTPELILDW